MSSRPFHVGRAYTGLGLFATRVIKRNGYIATYRGPILSAEEAVKREQKGAKYMFELTKKLTIDGSPRSNVARYMNHSCWPNAKPMIDTKNKKITFVALRNILPGEEITYNYGAEYYKYFLAIGGCLCAGCRIRAAARREKKTPPAHAAAPRKTNGRMNGKTNGKANSARKTKGAALGSPQARKVGKGDVSI
jgi:hypothetical protein